MSPQWNTALTGFMQKMGFEDFRIANPDAPSVNNIVIGEGRYVLDIEELSDSRGIIMACFKQVLAHELYDQAQRLLRACHYDKFLPLAVQVGLRGEDTLVLMSHVEQAWADGLSRAFDLMYKIYTQAEA